MKQNFFCLSFALFCSLFLFPVQMDAVAFESGGIYYCESDYSVDNYVAVYNPGTTYLPNGYSGNIVIPTYVKYNGVEYTVKQIKDKAFYNAKKLKSIVLPSCMLDIGNYAFQGCTNLDSATIWCQDLGIYAFNGCTNLKYVNLHCSKYIYDNAFSGCSSLNKISIANCGLKSIGSWAFYDCPNIKEVTIPSGVTEIETGAFASCSSLRYIIIPASVTSISQLAFDGCTSLTKVSVLSSTLPSLADKNAEFPFDQCTLYVDSTVISSYKNNSYWSKFNSIEKITHLSNTYVSLTPSHYDTIEIGQTKEYTIPISLTDASIAKITWDNSCQGDSCVQIIETSDDGLTSKIKGISKGIVYWNGTILYMDGKESSDIYETFTVSPKKYTITYNVDGALYAAQNYEEGATITPLAEPVKEGYTFSGWSTIPSIMPAKDITITGTFTKIPLYSTDISNMTDVLYSAEKTVKSGGQIVLPIYMKNSASVTLFQTNVYLPDGFSFAKKTSGKYAVSLIKDRITDEDDNHVISANLQSDGSLLILCSSQDNYTFDGNNGQVATVTIDVDDDLDEGQYLIKLNNQKMVNPDNTGNNVDTYQIVTTVKNVTLGDINDDGSIDGYDLVGISNFILDTNTTGLNRDAADVNQDGDVDGYDYVMEVNTILGTNTSSAKSLVKTENAVNELSALTVSPMTFTESGQAQINVDIECNGDAFTLVQADIELPEGMKPIIKNGHNVVKLVDECLDVDDDHTISCFKQSNDKYRILIMSQSNTSFNGFNGKLFTIEVETSKDMNAGLYDVTLSNINFFRANNTGVNPSDHTAAMLFGDATVIGNIEGEQTEAVMYNLSGQRVNENVRHSIYIINGKKNIKK